MPDDTKRLLPPLLRPATVAKRRSRLSPEPFPGAEEAAPVDNVAAVRAILLAAAAAGQTLTYAQCLSRLGHRFSRPKMRLLCRTIGRVDETRAPGEPALGVLVVRAADGLPGSGWWEGTVFPPGISRSGPDAKSFVAGLQAIAFRHWRPP